MCVCVCESNEYVLVHTKLLCILDRILAHVCRLPFSREKKKTIAPKKGEQTCDAATMNDGDENNVANDKIETKTNANARIDYPPYVINNRRV